MKGGGASPFICAGDVRRGEDVVPGADAPFNHLFSTYFWFSVAIGVFVAIWLTLNILLYRVPKGKARRRAWDAPKPGMFPHHRGSHRLELAWTVIPSIIV